MIGFIPSLHKLSLTFKYVIKILNAIHNYYGCWELMVKRLADWFDYMKELNYS